jgi:Zn-dependent peptidase ImmA (M78 family)
MSDVASRLDFIFGPGSVGSTEAERARTSKRSYVRSQLQIAFASPEATGRVLTAVEALESFGSDVLEKVAADGAARLIATAHEPAATLKARREHLRLSSSALARSLQVPESQIEDAETPGLVTPFRLLQKLAELLSLDERALSWVPGAMGDERIASKLRDMRAESGRDEQLVAALSEASWVIGRHVELQKKLGMEGPLLGKFEDRSDDYRKRVAERGYMLAGRTRKLLGIPDGSPIFSLRNLAETTLGVPVVEAELGNDIAGATISVGGRRGIVLSAGLEATSRVMFRRMTLAHELAHLLWDPDDRLDPVQVDDLDAMSDESRTFDEVEGRANAFAAALLAPAAAVREINRTSASPTHAVLQIVQTFGVSAPAARFHLANICKVRLDDIELPKTTKAAHATWQKSELEGGSVAGRGFVPPLRAGRFAELVRTAQLRGDVSADTAASWLRITPDQLERIAPQQPRSE